MSEKVSIIIPVFEAAKTIERCVRSILDGDYKNVQVILVEDGSQDDSAIICERISKQNSQVIFLKNDKNRGVSYTRNRGLEHATGKYLMFVDSDDWVENDYVSSMVELFEKNNGGIPICGYVNHDELMHHRTDIFGWDAAHAEEKQPIEDCLSWLYDHRLLQMMCNKLYVTEIVKKHEICFQEGLHVGEDFRFLLEYLLYYKNKYFIICNKPLYHYNCDNCNSLATKFTEVDIKEPLRDLEKMYRLTSMSEQEIRDQLVKDRTKQIRLYAYAIMHDDRFSKTEKKLKIQKLAPEEWKQLYRENKILYMKEVIRKRF